MFACSPHVSVSSLGTPASPHSPKTSIWGTSERECEWFVFPWRPYDELQLTQDESHPKAAGLQPNQKSLSLSSFTECLRSDVT